MHFYGPNRTVCDVLIEIRKCHKTRNYSGLLGLVEEVQTMANRMEAKLHDIADLRHMENTKIRLKREIAELEAKAEQRGGYSG